MEIRNETVIAAPVPVVWQLTEDIARWPATTPTVRRIERLDAGPLRPGSRARLWQPRLPRTVWTVTRIEAERLFEWNARVFGVRFTGRHVLEPAGTGCRNTLVLVLSGPGARVLSALAGRSLRASLEAENAGFKRRAEARAPR